MFLLDTQLVLFLLGCYTSILNGSSHVYVVAVIGFNQTVYTVEEDDGTVEACVAFLDPGQIGPSVVVELMGSTSPSTYPACCVNVYSTVVSQNSTHGQSTLPVCQRGGLALFQVFPHSTIKDCRCQMLMSLKQIIEQTIMHIQVPAIKVKS